MRRAKATAPSRSVALADQLVDQAHRRGLVRRHVAARGHHLEGLARADDARQALRAAGAGQQAEVHLGQAAPRAGHGDAVVGAQRHLEPAAERRAVDGGDHRLGRALHHRLHVEQAGPLRVAPPNSVMSAPAMNVRPSQIRTMAVAAGSAIAASKPSNSPSRTLKLERVHGRRVEGDDGDVALEREVGDLVDGGHESLRTGCGDETLRAGGRLFVVYILWHRPAAPSNPCHPLRVTEPPTPSDSAFAAHGLRVTHRTLERSLSG